MRVDVLGVVAVHGRRDAGNDAGNDTGDDTETVIAGAALGGRRARLVLVALAVAGGPVPAERLAQVDLGRAAAADLAGGPARGGARRCGPRARRPAAATSG